MALTKESPIVTDYIVNLFKNNADELGIKADNVWRGDHSLIPEYPAITVRSGPKRRTFATLRQYEIDFRTIITVMYGQIGEIELSEHQVEEFAEKVESVLHDDRKLGEEPDDNLVYNSWVELVDPGIRLLGTRQIRATRLTHRALSREVF